MRFRKRAAFAFGVEEFESGDYGRGMALKVYLSAALLSFIGSTTVADVIARTSIGGQAFGHALRDHLYWAGVQGVGTILLLAPFVAVAVICAGVERRARTRSAAAIFAVATLTLAYFYFTGHLAAQQLLAEERWTAAALSIGLLPFFIGVPVVLVTVCAGAIAAGIDRRASD